MVDDVYAEDEYGSHILHSLERARRFNRWMAGVGAPVRRPRVLEIGAGIGNITVWLLPRDRYRATDINPNYLDYLAQLVDRQALPRDRPARSRERRTSSRRSTASSTPSSVSTCSSTSRNPTGAPQPAGACSPREGAPYLRAAGPASVLAARRGARSSSSLLGERCCAPSSRRPDSRSNVSTTSTAPRVLGWLWNGKVLRRRRFSRVQLKLFDLAVPLLRHVDSWLPWRGLGLMAVGRKPAAGDG